MLTVEEAVRRIRNGRMIIVVDDAHRENEGDVVFAAEKATPRMVNFAVKHGRGILCAPMSPEEADRLDLKLMVAHNTAKFGTPFTAPAPRSTIGRARYGRSRRPVRAPLISCVRATCFRCAPCPAACCAAPGTVKRCPTCAAWRA
jgi:hypothetical protein